MNKLFGTSKPKEAPKPATNINAPTLGETSAKVSNRVSKLKLFPVAAWYKREGDLNKDRWVQHAADGPEEENDFAVWAFCGTRVFGTI